VFTAKVSPAQELSSATAHFFGNRQFRVIKTMHESTSAIACHPHVIRVAIVAIARINEEDLCVAIRIWRMKRENFATGTKWEPIVGYSRAVKVGNMVFVTGTTATNEKGEVVGVGDAYSQAKQTLANIERVLVRAGATMKDVVRTRMFVTDISRWEEVGRAHAEYFRDIRPATTMVEVSKLISPDMLVEIEADAVIGSES
jgi:reactive intermediate/imine deaminase